MSWRVPFMSISNDVQRMLYHRPAPPQRRNSAAKAIVLIQLRLLPGCCFLAFTNGQTHSTDERRGLPQYYTLAVGTHESCKSIADNSLFHSSLEPGALVSADPTGTGAAIPARADSAAEIKIGAPDAVRADCATVVGRNPGWRSRRASSLASIRPPDPCGRGLSTMGRDHERSCLKWRLLSN